MPETIHPEDLPAIIEKRKLDEHTHASVMDNGVIVIGSQTGGIEIILDAKRAFALLGLLYDHKDMLDKFARQSRQGRCKLKDSLSGICLRIRVGADVLL